MYAKRNGFHVAERDTCHLCQPQVGFNIGAVHLQICGFSLCLHLHLMTLSMTFLLLRFTLHSWLFHPEVYICKEVIFCNSWCVVHYLLWNSWSTQKNLKYGNSLPFPAIGLLLLRSCSSSSCSGHESLWIPILHIRCISRSSYLTLQNVTPIQYPKSSTLILFSTSNYLDHCSHLLGGLPASHSDLYPKSTETSNTTQITSIVSPWPFSILQIPLDKLHILTRTYRAQNGLIFL